MTLYLSQKNFPKIIVVEGYKRKKSPLEARLDFKCNHLMMIGGLAFTFKS